LAERGFNQVLLLALGLSRRYSIPTDRRSLGKRTNTLPQVGLSRAERMENLKGSFTADEKKVKNKRILLIDDVFTTGSTIREAAGTLSAAGAASVHALVLALRRMHDDYE
jgi:ComF family protein